MAAQSFCQPAHLWEVIARFTRDEDVLARKRSSKRLNDPSGATDHVLIQRGIGFIQPCRQADPAGQRIQFRDGHPGFRQHQVRPQHARQVFMPARIPPQLGDPLRLALIQQHRHPWILRIEVQPVASALKRAQRGPEVADQCHRGRIQCKRLGGKHPFLLGKKALLRKGGADLGDRFSGRYWH